MYSIVQMYVYIQSTNLQREIVSVKTGKSMRNVCPFWIISYYDTTRQVVFTLVPI